MTYNPDLVRKYYLGEIDTFAAAARRKTEKGSQMNPDEAAIAPNSRTRSED